MIWTIQQITLFQKQCCNSKLEELSVVKRMELVKRLFSGEF